MVVDQLPRLGKRELICLLLFTCNYVVSVWRGFLFLWVLGMGYVILLWHSLSLPNNCFEPLKPHFYMVKVIEKQRTGTGAIKRQIPLLKPKREIDKYYK